MEIRIKLNPDNEKDKLIIEMLKGEYITPSQFIKNVLYKIASNSNSIIVPKSGLEVENSPQKGTKGGKEKTKKVPKSGLEVAKSPQQSPEVDSEWSKYF